MGKYLLQRFIHAPTILLGISLLVFVLVELAPGDRVAMVRVGHQEDAALAETQVGLVPDGLNLRDASISHPCAWAVSALHLGQYAAAETVVVVGQGLVGASAALMAHQMGARVLALETDPVRVEFARGLGCGPVAQPDTPGATAPIAAFVGETGADLILETSGAWQGFRQAVTIARDWTRIAVTGIYRQPPPADLALELHRMLYTFPSRLRHQRLQIIGCGYDPDEVELPNPRSATRRRNFDSTLELVARGRLPVGRLVTHVFPTDELPGVLARLAAGDTRLVGVVFDWTETVRGWPGATGGTRLPARRRMRRMAARRIGYRGRAGRTAAWHGCGWQSSGSTTTTSRDGSRASSSSPTDSRSSPSTIRTRRSASGSRPPTTIPS